MACDDRLCRHLLQIVEKLSLLRRRYMKFGLFDQHDKVIAPRLAQTAKPHEQHECLKRDDAVAMPTARQRRASHFLKVRHHGIEYAVAVGRGQSKTQIDLAAEECFEIVVHLTNER